MLDREPQINVGDIDSAPEKLPFSGADFDWVPKYFVLVARLSDTSEQLLALREEHSELKANNNTRALLDELIVPFANKTFHFMCWYCGFVGLALAVHGFKLFGFHLPDTVLSYLVGSTAVTVIGLVGMVLTGVFVGGNKKS